MSEEITKDFERNRRSSGRVSQSLKGQEDAERLKGLDGEASHIARKREVGKIGRPRGCKEGRGERNVHSVSLSCDNGHSLC